MLAGFDAVQRSFFAFEHAHQLAVDISVGVVAAFAFSELELEWNFVTFEDWSLVGERIFIFAPSAGLSALGAALALSLLRRGLGAALRHMGMVHLRELRRLTAFAMRGGTSKSDRQKDKVKNPSRKCRMDRISRFSWNPISPRPAMQ